MNAKTFTIRHDDGATSEARQLATFAHYIKGRQFRFVVTLLPGFAPCLTHRASTKLVCDVTIYSLSLTHTPKECGVYALEQLIKRVGEDRVFDILSAAERA